MGPTPPGPLTRLQGAVGVSGAKCAGAGKRPPPSAAEALAGLTSKKEKGAVFAQGEGTAWHGSAASQESGGGASNGSAAGEVEVEEDDDDGCGCGCGWGLSEAAFCFARCTLLSTACFSQGGASLPRESTRSSSLWAVALASAVDEEEVAAAASRRRCCCCCCEVDDEIDDDDENVADAGVAAAESSSSTRRPRAPATAVATSRGLACVRRFIVSVLSLLKEEGKKKKEE